jgi:Spy/CpxP family protein refolding chaperone
MRLANIIPVGLIVLMATGTLAWGQPPQGTQPAKWKWWQDEKSKAELNLTAEQSNKIEEIFQASFPKLREGYEQLDRLESKVSKQISADQTTEAELLRQVDAVESVRSELSKARTLMLFRMERLLSPEQRAKLDEMHRNAQRDRPRGPGR